MMPGSIRTDVTLRNEQGDIIAIYDLETGNQTMSVSRANELRELTRSAPDTPVLELNVVRGPSKKFVVSRTRKPARFVRLQSSRHARKL
jgi:hypothetical protein